VAFGFDLSLLLIRAAEIIAAAEDQRREDETRKRVRERCVLRCRDAVKLLDFLRASDDQNANTDALDDKLRLLQRYLRRKLTLDQLRQTEQDITHVLDHLTTFAKPVQTPDLSGNDSQIERHQSNSNTETFESDSATNKREEQKPDAPLPLTVVMSACPEIQSFTDHPITTWTELIKAVETVYPMIGITSHSWGRAVHTMGAVDASLCVLVMLERFHEIRQPNAYLSALTRKHGEGGFSTRPMILALLNKGQKAAA
jgi:replication initiation protein RepC